MAQPFRLSAVPRKGGGKKKPTFEEEFDAIWKHYPRKIGRGKALKAFIARRREGVHPRDLYNAVCLYEKQRKGQDQKYTMHGATFFGPDERWKEPFEQAEEGPGDGLYRPDREDLDDDALDRYFGGDSDPLASL